jgi:hypothetical protein
LGIDRARLLARPTVLWILVLQKTGSPDGKYIFVTTPRAKGVVII